MIKERTYIAIDLKSFYASVECIERNLDPLTTNLVVADKSRTSKTICLAVSPSLKSFGISGRPRLFEVEQKVREINRNRRYRAPGFEFSGASYDFMQLQNNPTLKLDYIAAPPRMAHYIKYSTEIYQVYLKYIAPEDIHVYSIDEVFIDASSYLNTYKMNGRELASTMIQDVLNTTGITATAGIGTNLYLCKVAMDILAKHAKPDKNGVRIAELDELSYRKHLWHHQPLTDFWRVGKGYAKKLADNNMFTMGDIARCSCYNEDLLYKLFGINAELLIDHAWGWEPCTMKAIKSYKPSANSIGSGQVLHSPYTYEKALLVLKEMADSLALDLVDKNLVTNQIVLTIGYDMESLNVCDYNVPITTDAYGRKIPKHGHGTNRLSKYSSSSRIIVDSFISLYERIMDKKLLVRKLSLTVCNVLPESQIRNQPKEEQLNLFIDYEQKERENKEENIELKKEKNVQQAILDIKRKYGKNSILKANSLVDGATAKDRNNQIGGHKA